METPFDFASVTKAELVTLGIKYPHFISSLSLYLLKNETHCSKVGMYNKFLLYTIKLLQFKGGTIFDLMSCCKSINNLQVTLELRTLASRFIASINL